MKLSSTLTTLLIAPYAAVTVSAAYAQVNFYYDKACKDYAGHAFPTPVHGPVGGPIPASNVVGGPSGSQSMLWVYSNVDNYDGTDCQATYPVFCKNKKCSAYDAAPGNGVCKTFANGVWAAFFEECGEPVK